jgi:TfoX/Sxy family transcriptional regulator of competence genes
MTYDEDLARRFRTALDDPAGITEKRMMGGLCFFLNGNMLGGVDRTKAGQGRFMFRVGKEAEAQALKRPGAEPVVLGGRRMGGLIFVDEKACGEKALRAWVVLAMEFVSILPRK